MTGAAVIAAYHDLWQVERSFRMAKTDLRARPVFHRQRDSIEAHLTIVFAALAISRYLQEQTGASIKNSSTPYARSDPQPSRSTANDSRPGDTTGRPQAPHRAATRR
jgi:transposase